MATPQLCTAAQCRTILNFEPLSPWPDQLPGVAIDGIVIAGFEQKLLLNYPWTDQSAEVFLDLFVSVHPHLSFMELLNLGSWFRADGGRTLPMSLMEKILERYGYRQAIDLESWIPRLNEVPPSFRNWSGLRGLSPQELSPLLSLEPSRIAELHLDEIPKRELSRREGARALELLVELFLMNIPFLAPDLNRDRWLTSLQKLRYPQTELSDNSAQTWISGQIWPKQSQIRWVRRGDRAGLEVKMLIQRPRDLQKSVERLQQIFDEAPESVWPRH